MNEIPGPGDIPITDNHLHVDPVSGLGPVEVARQFARSGGTHALVVNKMVGDWGFGFTEASDFERATRLFLECVDRINADTCVRAYAVVGPHPVELVRLWQERGQEEAISLYRGALEHSGAMVKEGRAVAIGEVGRPHFEVDGPIMDACNGMLDLSLGMAAEIGCAVQLHMESSTPEQYRELGKRARKAGLDPGKVVRHFSGPLVRIGEETGIMPSVVASKGNLREALGQGARFLMETDYIDERSRPGAVLGPRTVPKVTRWLLQEGLLDLDSAARIHSANVSGVYGIDVSI